MPYHIRNNIYRLDHFIPKRLLSVSDSLVHTILITGCFFFKLDQEPILKQGVFYYKGSILYKSHNSKSLLGRVRKKCPRAQFSVLDSEYLGLPNEYNRCPNYRYYRKKCTFTINNLDKSFTIELSSSYFKQKPPLRVYFTSTAAG
ncbi:Acyl transferase/acyl hydrolase/lysophospholipase [Penicillium longicatenatum]|nr:Acyl transferase/acyl hydrolase/lysophospholipase [Penicillium longicatenatum]